MSTLKFTQPSSKPQVAILFLALSVGWVGVLSSVQPVSAQTTAIGARAPESAIRFTAVISSMIYLPFIGRNLACPVSGGAYNAVYVIGPAQPEDPPAELHPDINLEIRGYTPTVGTLGLVDIDGPSDVMAPQLATLFTDNRVPVVKQVYQVYDWDWENDVRGNPITRWVTLAGFGVATGEPICTPSSGYDIGRSATGYEVMVLYASTNRITLKYTRDDSVAVGYTIHIENINVDPGLLASYQAMNNQGRVYLPALFAGQHIGRAISTQLQVSIRDSGQFMDPRSHKDWWQGK
jgi:hypothetical protein